ncbi:putative ACT domain containing protein [Lyophyllum shimeji]|uniref:ACT domain containing protein n=1 Tax=Lyophyllum shimeji TaxID=47721 RepID=A0A9P3UID3_LYOSH|nr:putative ACT domain containing protein [Lyophyllum shimeji]
MQATISLLTTSLSLVHIPRSRLHQLSHPVLKQILLPNPTFLNITCNELELSLFADEAVLADFEPIARKDRHRQRSVSNASSGRPPGPRSRDIEPVEVSYERWSVLQVDSHSDQLDNSGARVNEVSAPLAAAGISILYQSSYMSDFILVKESRLQETMSLLADAGFDIYTGSDTSPISPARMKDRSSLDDARPIPAPAVPITRPRSATDSELIKPDSSPGVNEDKISAAKASSPARKKSSSPTAGEVLLLPSDLACVGLSEELGADHWGLKIVKLVAFPELITPSAPPPYPSHAALTPTTMTNPLYSLRKSSTPLFDFSPPLLGSQSRSSSPFTSSSNSGSSSEDDGYFSYSPQTKSLLSVITSASRSETELREPSTIPSPDKHRSRRANQPLSPAPPAPYRPLNADPAGPGPSPPRSQVPFFSYTRTSEGSSLTADVYVLAALFPPPERDMIICSGELDAADSRLARSHRYDDAEDDEGVDGIGSILSCLQIDLQRFGLDKYGLVNRFSKVLEENRINHMYSSSFKTANLLVDKKHARRAQALLCGC